MRSASSPRPRSSSSTSIFRRSGTARRCSPGSCDAARSTAWTTRPGKPRPRLKAQAYYWLHLLPLLIAMGLALALMIISAVLSIVSRRRGTWLPRLLNGLFGGLLFVSPPFRALAQPLPVGQMSWLGLSESGGVFLRDHLHVGGATAAWVPEFLIGFLAFLLARLLFDWLRR